MIWLRKINGILNDWFQGEFEFLFVEDLPEKVIEKTIYTVGNKQHLWLLAFKCPCGCKALIQLNLLKDTYPCWDFYITKQKKITISPSIRRTKGCFSHFYIYKSKIVWVPSNQNTKNISKANKKFNNKK